MKIGVVSCSGEDCLGGTISRLATRKMLDEIHPEETVTICLPLFLAGGIEERSFAQNFPTITVDGCDKYCAKRATEKYSGKVSDYVMVADIIGKEAAESGPLSTKNLSEEHRAMVNKVAAEIKRKFEAILNGSSQGTTRNNGCGCGCGCGC
ncbi:putative zinc-binding protein [Desulfofundulus sp.]|uniref:putative zinc-binding protein n=1 Tax=Desulfofundulus sp. TaxID=2282750 RepID=UPI003C7664B7